MSTTIKTNNIPREILDSSSLTKKEREQEFSYYSDEEIAFAQFVRYKGHTYDLSEFTRAAGLSGELGRWGGIHNETYFSGILIRFVDDFERVIMGRYYC